MKKAVLALGLLAFSAPVAGACEYKRSVQADTDKTVVASIAKDKATNMSTPAQPATGEAAQPQITDQN